MHRRMENIIDIVFPSSRHRQTPELTKANQTSRNRQNIDQKRKRNAANDAHENPIKQSYSTEVELSSMSRRIVKLKHNEKSITGNVWRVDTDRKENKLSS